MKTATWAYYYTRILDSIYHFFHLVQLKRTTTSTSSAINKATADTYVYIAHWKWNFKSISVRGTVVKAELSNADIFYSSVVEYFMEKVE